MLENKYSVNPTMKLHFQYGINITHLIEEVYGYPVPAWCAPAGIINVLTLSKVKRYYKVTFNSTGTNTLTVHG